MVFDKIKYHILFTVIFSIISFSSFPTTFIPLEFSQQLKESDGAVLARYVERDQRRISSGMIVTEATFKLVEGTEINTDRILPSKILSVVYPGGIFEGDSYFVSGAPDFKKGELYLLLLKETHYGYTLSNFSLGKYNTIVEGQDLFFSSSVFPNDEKLRKLSYDEVNTALANYLGSSFKNVEDLLTVEHQLARELELLSEFNQSPVVRDTAPSIGRSPASYKKAPVDRKPSSHRKDKNTKDLRQLWIVLSFFAIGAYSAVMRRKQRRSK